MRNNKMSHFSIYKAQCPILLSSFLFRVFLLILFLGIISYPSLTVVHAATISRKFGDVNNNGMIDSGDTLLILRHLSAINERSVRINHPEWCLSGYDLKAADVNQNGKTDIGDQLKVLRHISAQNDSSVKAEHPDWILSKSFSCSFPANGFYILISALNNNKAVDLNGGSTNNGANIQLWSTNNTYAQVFHLIRKGQYYTMTNIATGKAIDVKGGSNSQGTNIQQYQVLSSKDNNAQLWKLESAGNGYYYIRSKIGNYMDVKNGGTKDGTNILTWEYNGGNNQKFKLVNVAKREPMYTQANLNLRNSNSTTSDVLAVMPKSSLVYRYCTAGDWSLISYNGKKGYASSKYLSKDKYVKPETPSFTSPNYAKYTGIDYTKQTNSGNRINALKKAQKMVTIKWTCPTTFVTWSSKGGSYNSVVDINGNKSNSFIKGRTYVGIPYSMINHLYDDSAWLNLINKGFSRDTIEGKMKGYRKKGTSKGVDCSYFVYLCWKAGGANISYKNTSAMVNDKKTYVPISKSTMKPGDILLKKGHVMLFVGKSGNNYAVFEATAFGSKTRYKVYTASEINSYSARRYVNW